MTKASRFVVVLGLFLAAAAGLAEVVVLRGGAVIELKKAPVRQGKNVILTRTDGTLLSVPATEIDTAATTAARAAQPPPPAPAAALPATSLAGAARASREASKARVKITDADVSHNEAAQAPAGEAAAPDAAAAAAGGGRIEVGEYSQEKSGEALIVRGTLRNPGSTIAINVRMTVTALDPKGQPIGTSEAGVSAAAIEPSKDAAFTVTIPVGGKTVGSLRFTPRWIASEPAPPAQAGVSAAAGSAAAAPGAASPAAPPAAANAPPPPAPTPFGRGSLYAPPAPNAPSQPPPDGKTGYIPGASNPANQPKPPS